MAQTAAQCLLGLILVFAPWAFGTTEVWSWRVVQGLACAALGLAAVAVAGGTSSRESGRGATGRRPRGSSALQGLLLALLALYIATQALNASHRYQPADQSLLPQPHLAWLPHSVDAATTGETLGKLLTYAALFWTARASFTGTTHQRRLLAALVASGFVMAVFGVVQKLSGTAEIFWCRSPRVLADFFGPFVNRNNYAAYANLLLPVALALGRQRQQDAAARGEKSHPGHLLYLMAAALVASVIFSGSRAGIIVSLALVVGWTFTAARRSQPATWAAGLALIAVAVGLTWWLGTEPLRLHLEHAPTPAEELAGRGLRGRAYPAVWRMFSERWLFGIGAGTFACAFPYYQPDAVAGFWRYAHSDWLQYLAELGVVGTALFAALGAAIIWPRVNAHGRRRTALALGLAGVALHAAIDFPLHIPAVASLATVCLGLWSTSGNTARQAATTTTE